MKYILFTLIFTISSFAYSIDRYVVTANKINIREKPSKTSKSIYVAIKSDTLLVDSIVNEWAHVNIHSITGYANVNYIKKTKNVSTNNITIKNKSSFNWLAFILILIAIVGADIYFLKGFFMSIFINLFLNIKEGIAGNKSKLNISKDVEIKNTKRKILLEDTFKIEKKTYNEIKNDFDIHNASKEEIVKYLDNEKIGTIKKFGSSINIKNIIHEIGLKSNLKIILITRVLKSENIANNPHTKSNEAKLHDLLDYDYILPDKFPENPYQLKQILFSTIETKKCSPNEPCKACHGEGICSNCDSKGSVICNSCNGAKKIPTKKKHSNGKPIRVDCNHCKGLGFEKCNKCNGSLKCNTCKGDGDILCPKCNGSSVFQSYDFLETSVMPRIINYNYSKNALFEEIIQETRNKVVFNDDLLEYSNQKTKLFDNSSKAIQINNYVQNIIDNIGMITKLKYFEFIGRVNIEIENVPITIVEYIFEDEKYTLNFIGENKIIHYDKIPKNKNWFAKLFSK